MDRDEILGALTRLGELLVERGLAGDMYVVGGAAMAVAYDRQRSTRDVDAVFAPKQEIYQLATVVADERGLASTWLNDAVKGFLLGPDPFPTQCLDLPGLRVEVASPQMVLVLKCLARRLGEDDEDVRLLAARLGITTASEALALVERLVPADLLTAQVRFFVEAVLSEEGSPG